MLYSPIHINDEFRSYYMTLYSKPPPVEVDALHGYLEGLHLRTLSVQDSEQLGVPVDVRESRLFFRLACNATSSAWFSVRSRSTPGNLVDG
ncbi:hypothetical protein NDU88_001556 [Pleurodeles waltl]|uniref:Uncharacterized protein n=1 Tax=Pleurodeles waltl TaxID=8319 RepID=A0AAV7U7I2_PLEWA|nr:hypothetical protein NDU88_001556 [Pleurodeles waltl]